MRQSIETAPRDGHFIILEDVESGISDVAHWSFQAAGWISENGQATRIKPSHWYSMQGPFAVAAPEDAAAVAEEKARTQANHRSKLRLGFAASAATAALIGIYFHVEVAAFLTGYPDLRDDFRELATQDAARITQAVETSPPDARQSLTKEQRSETSANALAVSTQEAKAAQAMAAEPQRRALEEAQARAAALASELAGKSREIESQAAQSKKAADAATKQKQAAESTIGELRQALQQEQQKTATVMQEAKAAQAMAAAAEPQRRALEEAQARAAALASELAGKSREIESQAAQSKKAVDAATKQKQAAESTIGELRQALQQEQQKTATVLQEAKAAQAMAATARSTMDERVTAARLSDNQAVNVTQTIRPAATESAKTVEAQDSAEAARLIARASALLGQGNIGAARIVLERAAESGNARASFMLAETYDPIVLSAWGTYGTRAEAAKAREYYAKAHTGGIQEAKGRMDALRQ